MAGEWYAGLPDGAQVRDNQTGDIIEIRKGKPVVLGSSQDKAGLSSESDFQDAQTTLRDLQSTRQHVVGFTETEPGKKFPALFATNTGWIGGSEAPNMDASGKAGFLDHGMKGTPGYNLDSDLSSLRSRIKLQGMARLKALSPTGSTGFGALSGPENKTLEGYVASLDNSLPAGQLRQNMDRVAEWVIQKNPGVDPRNPIDLSDGSSRAHIPKGAYYTDAQGNIRRNDHGDDGNPIIKPAAPKAAAATPAPSGVDPKVWAHMTPQERALWN